MRLLALGTAIGLLFAIRLATAANDHVTIDNFTFGPTTITVPSGTTVTWTNHDDIPHTVVDEDDPRGTKSMPLDTGDVYARRFDKPGMYRYFCSLHPRMQGTVIVQ